MQREKEFMWKAQKLGLQLCQVYREDKQDTVFALFHGWEQNSNKVLMSSRAGVKQLWQVWGLCEDENGLIKRVDPERIRFIRTYDEKMPDFGRNADG